MESFSYPGWIKWLGGFGVLLFVSFAFILGWCAITSNDVKSALTIATASLLSSMMALGFIDMVRRSGDAFIVTEGGLSIDDHNGQRLVTWNQIAEIKSHDVIQRIELIDNYGERIVKIDYQLGKFDKLRDIILTRMMSLSKSEQRTFRTSWYARSSIIVMTILFVYLAILSLSYGPMYGMFMFSSLAVCMIGAYLSGVKTIAIEVNRITVKTAFKLKEIYFCDISSVVLRNKGDYHGNKIATVYVECKERKPVLFAMIQGGAPGLYRSIYEAWQATIKPV